MPYPATADPGEGESSTLAPVFPSANAYQSPREEEERSSVAGPSSSSSSSSSSRLLPSNRNRPLSNEELRRRAVQDDDAGAQVDLRIRQDAVVPAGLADGSSSSSSSACPTQQRLVPPKGWLHFVAGGIGGMCGAIITSPLDVVKTRLQSDLYKEAVQARTTTGASSSSSSGVIATGRRLAYHFVETGHLLREISTKEGPRALFKGLAPTLVGVVPARSINFFTYGNGKLLLAEHLNGGKEATWIHLLAAAGAGVVTATATNPIWVVKTRLQLEGQQASKREREERRRAVGEQRAREVRAGSPIVDAARKAYSTSSPSSSTSSSGGSSAASIRPPPSSSSSFFQGARSPPRPGTSSLEMTLRIIRTEGVTGLYKGMSASYLGVAEGTIQWVLYEYLKRISGEGGSGSGGSGSGGDSKKPSGGGGLANTISSAGLAKLTASLITYPHEVVRTRLRQDTAVRDAISGKLIPKYRGLVQTCLLVWREEGAASLYGGLSAHLLRVVPNAAVMFSIYEVALRLGSTRVEVREGEGEGVRPQQEQTTRQV